MPNEEVAPTEEVITAPEGQEPAAETPPADTPPAEPEQPEATEDEATDPNEDQLEEWVRKTLRDVRSEAAKYRTRLREMEAKFKDAKTLDEFNAALDAAKGENTQLERELVAIKYKLPEDLAAVLKGSTREELEAHAKVLAKYAPADDSEPKDVEGGLSPITGGGGPGTMNPAQLAKQHRIRR